ncbi:hypothetical protein A5686_06090 [Mycobacterium sp. E2479]|nr:hypothetical protein A5686_06090 [Mycobacterium sp. E2479]
MPDGAVWADKWRTFPGGRGRWLSVGDWEVTLVGYPDELAEPRHVTVFGLAFQRPSGEIANPYVHVESDPDHPLTLADTDELIAALGEVRNKLRSLMDPATL